MTTGLAARVFGVLYAALALTIAFEVFSHGANAPETIATRARTSLQTGPAAAAASASIRPDQTEQLVETVLARPLFSPNRRPPATASGNSGMPRLSGIVLSPAGRTAIFQPASGKRAIVVGKGETVDGWIVQDIATDAVTLARANEAMTLRPKFDAGQTAVAASTPAPPKETPSRWTQAAATGILRSRWSDPHLQPRRRLSAPRRRRPA